MKPELAMTIDAARDLAWQPTHNLGGRGGPRRLAERHESHERLVDALGRVTALSANASPELRYLVAAIHRVAACTFSNRMGRPYHERKQAVAELRGCLDVYDRSLVPASRSGPDSVAAIPVVDRRRRGRIGTPEPMPALL